MDTAEELIRLLKLEPLPQEGGFYRETARSAANVGKRSLHTAIYYLLTPTTYSAMHRLPGDEVFHFYAGDPVEMLQISAHGDATRHLIGADVLAQQTPQVLVPGGTWQGSRLAKGGRYALLGTTMAPGFDWADWEPGDCAALMAQFPDHAALIDSLRPQPA